MPNYEVGNLEIKFSALNEIDFEKLKDGLNKVKSAINNIGKIDSSRLDNFSKTLSNLSTTFLPFLKGVEKASGGLAIFNDTLRQVGGRGGARGLSAAVAEFQRLKDVTQETGEEAQQLNTNIANATEQIVSNTQEAKKSMGQLALEQQQSAIAANQQKIAYLKAQYALGTLNLTQQEYLSLLRKLENEQRRLSGEIPRPYNAAQVELAQIQSTLYNTYFSTQTVNQRLVEEYNALKKQIDDTTRAVKEAEMTDEERVIARQKDAIAANQQAIAYLKAQQGLGLLNMTQEQYLARIKELEVEQRRLRGEIEETSDEQQDADKNTKKHTSSWKKFLNQIKRIAIYRLIRTALRALTSTIKETIGAYAQVDDNVNQSMSQIVTSLQFIKLGFGSTILPLLQMIAPIVEQIGYAFADLGNMISASMSKDGKFTKINTKAWKDYREEIEKTNGALLDFDKFRVLNQQQGNLSDFLLPNQSVEEYFDENGINETAQRIKNIVYDLSTVLSDLFDLIGRVGTPIIKTILAFAEPVIWFVSGVIDLVTKFIDKLDELGILEPIIEIVTIGLIAWGSTKVIGAITKLATKLGTLKGGFLAVGIAIAGAFAIFDSWADMSTWQRVIGIIGVATTAILGLAVAFGAFHSAWSLGLAAAGIVAGIAMIVGAVSSAKGEIGKSVSVPITNYAKGGTFPPDKGVLIRAGEARQPEIVYGNSNGSGGVATMQQLEQAQYNALVRYGKEGDSRPIIINLVADGRNIFKTVEVEAGKQGKAFARK